MTALLSGRVPFLCPDRKSSLETVRKCLKGEVLQIGGRFMTSQEKQWIAVMRSDGMSYKAIATELNIPVNSVKTFCRRNSLGGVRAIENLSDEPEQNGLIDIENRGNSSAAVGLRSPESARIPVSQQAKVRLVFSETSDDDAITDVLGMLVRSKCRQE